MNLSARIAATFNRSGAARDNVVGGAAVPAVSRGSRGSGAPAARRARATIALVALAIAAFAITAAPASAASTEMGTISDVSYTSAEVTGKVSAAPIFQSEYFFQYCTVECSQVSAIWTTGATGSVPGTVTDQPVSAKINVPKADTKYFVRLSVFNFPEGEAISPGPNPDFTTLAVDVPSIPGPVDASPIFSTSAKAFGKVKRPTTNDDPAFNVTACRFEYVTDADFGTTGFVGAAVSNCDQPTPFTAPEGETDVTANLSGLSPSTTYHLRLAAENAAPDAATKEAAATFTTAPKVAKPTVIATDDVTEPGQNTAKVSGEVQRPAGDDPALNTSCRFEYVTDEQFTATGFEGASQASCVEVPPEAPLTTADPTPVTAELGGLKPATTYHLRLAAENEGGVDTKDANTFTTVPAELPVVTIDPVAGGTYTTAHVSGTVEIDDPGHTSSNVRIEFSTDNVSWSGVELTQSSGAGPQAVKTDFSGLQPSETYFFRVASKYSTNSWADGEANGEVAFSPEPNPSITTEPALPAPTATINPPSGITGTSAHLSGTVDPHAPAGPLSELAKKATATHWEFVCTPECKDANGNVISGTVQGEEGEQPVAGDVKRLEPDTEYEVSLVITSEAGGETKTTTFKTLKSPPSVKQTLGSSDGTGGYTLQGVVNPNKEAITDCKFEWGPSSNDLVFKADCSPMPIPGAKPTTVEAHLTGLTPDVDYYSQLVVTYGADLEEDSGDPQAFKATLATKERCPANEQIRIENNSLALPECRAYEMVSAPGKEGFIARLKAYSGGDRISYSSGAGNLVKSGQGKSENSYVAARSAAGWETIPDLNGSSGSVYDAPSFIDSQAPGPIAYSSDLLSSIWRIHRKGDPSVPTRTTWYFNLRQPDGSFTQIGPANSSLGCDGGLSVNGASADLSHLVVWGEPVCGATEWGPGVYEYVGVGLNQPRRVDVENAGAPASTCIGTFPGGHSAGNAQGHSISSDGRVIFLTVFGGCGGANPPTGEEIWARVDGTTSIDASASQCDRVAPAEPCNASANPTFQASTPDGSRVLFTTTQQLVDADTDQTNDLYACDIPSETPAQAGNVNPCPALSQVSGAQAGAAVETVGAVSDNGTTVAFIAGGELAANKDAFGESAAPGDHNLYVWHTNAGHQAGQTTFLGRLDSRDIESQATPDGRYLVFTTASQLVPTDTDNARDAYRYDADNGGLTRASTNVFGVAGNGGFDVQVPNDSAASNDGQKIVFTTEEALSPADGNSEPDLYLWTPGRVSLISTGSVGGGATNQEGLEAVRPGSISIDGSGQDIYFETPGALTPADGDSVGDVYDARIGGGFSFAPKPICTGEACQPPASGPLAAPVPATAQPPTDPGNVKPKTCPKGKVLKGNKCVKKAKKHHKKAHKKAGHNRGGSK